MKSKKRWSITSDKFLSTDQIKALLDCITRERDLAIARSNHSQAIRDYYLIRGLLETGLRAFEFCALTVSDISGTKLVVRRGKGDKARTVLLTRSTAHLLIEWLTVRSELGLAENSDAPLFPSRTHQQYSTRGLRKRVKAVLSAAQMPEHLSVHSLRHTYCSLLLSSGKVGIATARNNMGHHSIAVTDLYSHAIGDLSNIELPGLASAENPENSEPDQRPSSQNRSSSVKSYLRKRNLK